MDEHRRDMPFDFLQRGRDVLNALSHAIGTSSTSNGHGRHSLTRTVLTGFFFQSLVPRGGGPVLYTTARQICRAP